MGNGTLCRTGRRFQAWPWRRVGPGVVFLLLLALSMLVVQGMPAQAVVAGAQVQQGSNFDARVDYNQSFAPASGLLYQQPTVQERPDLGPGVAATYDKATGVTRTLQRPGGYLTETPSITNILGTDPLSIAKDFIAGNYAHLGLTANDLGNSGAYEVTDEVYSSLSGVTHIYLRQFHKGLPVYNGQLQINVTADGRILSVNNTCMPNIAGAAQSENPALSAGDAAAAAAAHLGIQLAQPPAILSAASSPNGTTTVRGDGISRSNIAARLMWLPIRAGEARLVWNLQIATLDGGNVYDLTVDAASGQVWTRSNWVAQDSYLVYPAPVESPIHSLSPPPADDRQTVVDPADSFSSPLGWHDVDGIPGPDFTTHRGNNVHAYDDKNDTNAGICTSTPSPPALEPDCGLGLDCDFPLDLSLSPGQSTSAAVTNLFYWNNWIHDVQYLYGFDEASGNFQQFNYDGVPGAGDAVLAEAQDGGGLNNANMCTPPDGQRPRMQMFNWSLTNPQRDGDFDNGIIVHEYGHGISNRLVGGPSNVNCLSNAQQPGEGLSDWWALVYTAKPGDLASDGRGIGTYALGQPPDGRGIRAQRYSTDPAINTHTYESIRGARIPHGVGEVWGQGMWEVYWALVNKHGFDPDLKNALGGSGNQRAMFYVNEGLKNTICSPTFTDVRDGILQAAAGPPYSGEDTCLLWESFAFFGLGEDAVSGGPNSTLSINGFGVPAVCPGPPTLGISATAPTAKEAGPVSGIITITRSRDTSTAQTILYTVSGTATPGVDYAPLSGSVDMAVGQTTATISIDPIDDTLLEPDKTVVVTITPDPGYVLGGSSPGIATVTIESNDFPPRVSVFATDPTATEIGPTSGAVTITRTLDTGRELTVNYAVSGTATPGDDYTALSGSVVLAPGQVSAVIAINPIDDSTPELGETVVVTILADPAYVTTPPTSATVTIVSEPAVSVTATDPTATEAGLASGAFTITRTLDTAKPLTITYAISGTATPGADYTALSGSVVLAAGQASAVIEVNPIDDGLLEFIDETVVMTLTADPAYVIATPADATVAIVSDETRPIVTLSVSDPIATETPLTSAAFTVTRVDNITAPMTVHYFVAGNAIQGTDYEDIGTSAIIPAGQASAIIEIVPIDDTEIENDENVQLIILSDATYEAVSPVSIVTIQSDDGIPLSVNTARWRDDKRRLDVDGSGAPPFANVVVRNEVGSSIGTTSSDDAGSWILRIEPLSLNGSPPCAVTAGTDGAAGAVHPVQDTTTSCPPPPTNNPAVAENDAYSTNEDVALTISAPGILNNDSDTDGDTLNAALVASPTNGILSLNPDGSFIYTPNANFSGGDNFTYTANDADNSSNVATVSITVTAVNDAPVAADEAYSTSEDVALTVPAAGVLINDTDVDGDALTATLVTGPANGALTLNSGGSFTYTPNRDFNGPDSFTYTANDTSGPSNVATVSITVTAVNDAPVAANDSYTANEDVPLSITAPGILGNDGDVESDALTAVLVTGPSNGTLTLNSGGNLTYMPNADFNGSDGFTYTANDASGPSNVATVSITVTAINDSPVAANDFYNTQQDTPLIISAPGILGNDGDVEGDILSATVVAGPTNGTLTLSPGGNFTYTPNSTFNGSDSFTYTADDTAGPSNVATVSIAVSVVNNLPVAANDAYTTNEDTPLTIAAPGILVNDSDVNGDTLTAMLVSGPANGTLTLNAGGSFTYTPNANFNGADSFTYTANDAVGPSNVATVLITANAVNDVPIAANDAYSTNEDTPLTIATPGLLTNDGDADGDILTAFLVAGPANGTLTLNSDGSFTYSPNTNFNGTDGFTYTANDADGPSNMATVSITVTAENDVPVAVNDAYVTNEDVALTISAPGILANDGDADGNVLSAVLAGGPSNGILSLNPNGSFTYTPGANFNGSDSFTYMANDAAGPSDLATVSITVNPMNDTPVAANDAYTTEEDTPLTIAAPGILDNDSDVEGDALTAIVTIEPSNGAVELNPDGGFTYTPNPTFNGADSFTYTSNDAAGPSNAATVTITVNALVGTDPITIAFDGFESTGFSGGNGAWSSIWTPSGDIRIRTNRDQPHAGNTHVRLRRNTGLLQRQVNLSGASDVRLRFWAKIDSFENSDIAEVKVSPDGLNFTTVKTFTAADSDNLYHFHEIALSGFQMTNGFVIMFDSGMSGRGDRWYLDDIEIFGVPAVIEAASAEN